MENENLKKKQIKDLSPVEGILGYAKMSQDKRRLLMGKKMPPKSTTILPKNLRAEIASKGMVPVKNSNISGIFVDKPQPKPGQEKDPEPNDDPFKPVFRILPDGTKERFFGTNETDGNGAGFDFRTGK